MSYTPTTWNTGDTITASALNKIENGIANAGGSSWDAIIRLTLAEGATSDDNSSLTPSIVEGTFAGLYAKYSNGEYPTILVEYADSSSDGWRFAVPMAYISYAYSEYIYIKIAGYSPCEGTFKVYGELSWNASPESIKWALS